MELIEEKILAYAALSPAEQEAVLRYVAVRPDMQPFLTEAMAFHAVLEEAHLLVDAAPHEEVLAYLAAVDHLPDRPLPEALRGPVACLRARIDASPEMQARYAAYALRLADLEAAGDAVSQFERLTGRSLAGPPPAVREQPADWRRPVDRVADREATGRPAGASVAGWLRQRRFGIGAGVFALALLYGVLVLVSYAGRSELDRLAFIRPQELRLDGYGANLRGGGNRGDDSPEGAYLRALSVLRGAYRAPLGLFPGYDADGLHEAAGLLRTTATSGAADAFLALEATYLLGKVELARGDTAAAAVALRTVVQEQGRQAAAARALLDRLTGRRLPDPMPG